MISPSSSFSLTLSLLFDRLAGGEEKVVHTYTSILHLYVYDTMHFDPKFSSKIIQQQKSF